MTYKNDDIRIKQIKELLSPVALLEKFPVTDKAALTVQTARESIHQILTGKDDRLLVVIGPCSIHHEFRTNKKRSIFKFNSA